MQYDLFSDKPERLVLRDYQAAAQEAVYNDFNSGVRRVLCVMATGLGKTPTFVSFAMREDGRNRRTLMLFGRDKLIDQAAADVRRWSGLGYGVERAEQTAVGMDVPIVLASVQSLISRLHKYPPDAFDLIVADEAHHSLSDTWQRIITHFTKARLAGFTATGFRGDKLELGGLYDKISCEYNLKWGVANGHLCPLEAETLPVDIPVESKTLTDEDGDKAVTPYLEALANALKATALNRQVIAFLPLRKTSRAFADISRQLGFNAWHVEGGMKGLDGIFNEFRHAGQGSMLCNSRLCIEGYNCPPIDCVANFTPTNSLVDYCQKIGRGTRLHEGKGSLYIPDVLWHSAKHNLCHPAQLFAETKEVAEAMTRAADSGGVKNLDQLYNEAERQLLASREAKLAEELQSYRGRSSQKFDPVVYGLSMLNDSLIKWEPSFAWEKADVTEGQAQLLKKNGVVVGGMSKGFASELITEIVNRRSKNLCSVKQMKALLKFGYANAPQMTFDEARTVLDTEMPKRQKAWDKSRRYQAYKKRMEAQK